MRCKRGLEIKVGEEGGLAYGQEHLRLRNLHSCRLGSLPRMEGTECQHQPRDRRHLCRTIGCLPLAVRVWKAALDSAGLNPCS